MMPCFRVGDQLCFCRIHFCHGKKVSLLFECSVIRLNRRGRHSESPPVI